MTVRELRQLLFEGDQDNVVFVDDNKNIVVWESDEIGIKRQVHKILVPSLSNKIFGRFGKSSEAER